VDFRKNDERSRYELVDNGRVVAIADYIEWPDLVVFPHTVVDPARRGQGLGAELVQQALDDVRGTGRRVMATCWFVADFIRSNPEYGDLLAA
jgi:predicted GNAT family acetyltransferase